VIVLTNTISITADTVLDGTGQSVTISGNDQVRLLNVGSNVEFTVINLALVRGKDVGANGDSQTDPEVTDMVARFILTAVLLTRSTAISPPTRP